MMCPCALIYHLIPLNNFQTSENLHEKHCAFCRSYAAESVRLR